MSVEEILPHIYAIRGAYVNIFLIAEEDELALVDTGLKGYERAVYRALRGIERRPDDIHHILLTHHHADHVGSLATLKERTQAKAYVHPIDAPIVAGDQKRPSANPKSMLGRVLGPIIERLPQNKPPVATADVLVNEGDTVPVAGGMTVLHTPGHTLGSISFLMQGHGGVLFAGDAAANVLGRLGGSPPLFTEDTEAAKASIRRLAELEFDTACFGHGRVLKGKATAAFKRFVEKVAR